MCICSVEGLVIVKVTSEVRLIRIQESFVSLYSCLCVRNIQSLIPLPFPSSHTRRFVKPLYFFLIIFISDLALSYTDKLMVFKMDTHCAPIVAALFLFCYEKNL